MEREKLLSKCHYSNELETREYPERVDVLDAHKCKNVSHWQMKDKIRTLLIKFLPWRRKDKEEIEKPYRKTQ